MWSLTVHKSFNFLVQNSTHIFKFFFRRWFFVGKTSTCRVYRPSIKIDHGKISPTFYAQIFCLQILRCLTSIPLKCLCPMLVQNIDYFLAKIRLTFVLCIHLYMYSIKVVPVEDTFSVVVLLKSAKPHTLFFDLIKTLTVPYGYLNSNVHNRF